MLEEYTNTCRHWLFEEEKQQGEILIDVTEKSKSKLSEGEK